MSRPENRTPAGPADGLERERLADECEIDAGLLEQFYPADILHQGVAKRLRKAAAALRGTRGAVPVWRPISEHDGTGLGILGWEGNQWGMRVMHFRDGKWQAWQGQGEAWPTHFMPLPGAPDAAEGDPMTSSEAGRPEEGVETLVERYGRAAFDAGEYEPCRSNFRSYKEALNHMDAAKAELLAALRRPVPRGTPVAWMPIESAPRDGTRVLLWDGYNRSLGYWGGHAWMGHNGLRPSHFQPLPAPPLIYSADAPEETR